MERTRVIGYVRVSLEKQADTGVSLDAQRAKIEQYAALYDLNILEILVDAGESAKSLERPQLQLALARLRAGTADALLVCKLDRLTRSVADLGRLIDEHFGPGGSALFSVGEQIDTRSAGGRMMLNLITTISQWEREVIGERTAEAMQHKAARGEYTGGGAPLGFRVVPGSHDGAAARVEPEPREQAAIALARSLRAERLSLRAVARRLEAAGFTARSGARFDAQQVARMCEPDKVRQ
jgi:DNA invertase Pin-like site-specific DNA recombinase